MNRLTFIESDQNPRFKRWKKCLKGQVRKTGVTLVSGEKVTLELAQNPQWNSTWLVPEGWEISLPGSQDRTVFMLSKELFSEVDSFGTGHPLLEVEIPEALPDSLPLDSGMALVVPFQDPRNVGAVIRTAVGMGIPLIYIWESGAYPFHPLAVRASAGAVFQARLSRLPSFEVLNDRGIPLVVLEAEGTPAGEFVFPDKCALLPGIEGPGIPEEALNFPMLRVSLPMANIESYNATVATALALYEWRTRRDRI